MPVRCQTNKLLKSEEKKEVIFFYHSSILSPLSGIVQKKSILPSCFPLSFYMYMYCTSFQNLHSRASLSYCPTSLDAFACLTFHLALLCTGVQVCKGCTSLISVAKPKHLTSSPEYSTFNN